MPLASVWMLRGCLCLSALLLGSTLPTSVSAAVMPSDNKLPSIKHVAVMPVYWQGHFPEGHPFAQLKKHLDEEFSPLARASKRFYFTNDVITSDLWATPEGRKELLEEYEIDGVLNLTVTGQSDLMLWTVRLLSPNLVNYISESDRVPYAWFLAASPAEIDKRLQDLLFRTLNRYPIDVFVTSIQGRYLSLSSGSEQNIFEGDEVSFYDFTLKSLHPVDSSWLSFDKKLLGKAKVIESKAQSSIAVITSLSYENAIRTGDGASVANIATRRNFQAPKAEDQRYVPVSKDSALVEAVGETPKPLGSAAEKMATLPTPPAPARIAAASPAEPTPSAPQGVSPPTVEEGLARGVPDEKSGAEATADDDLFPIHFQDAHIFAITENFNYSGAGKVSSRTPDLFINRLDARVNHQLTDAWEGWYRIGARSGDTSKGEYTGFNAQAEALHPLEAMTARIPSLNRVLIGGLLRLDTLGVSGKKEKFGGVDGLFLGPTIHLQGSRHVAEWVQTIDYDIQLTYILWGQGTAGISGKKRDLDSGSTMELGATALMRGKPEEVEWGGFFNFDKGSWKLSKGSLDMVNLSLGVVAHVRL